MATLRFTVRGTKKFFEIRKRVREFNKRTIGGLPEPASRITTALLGFVQRRFAQARRGRPPADWPKLSKFTVFVRRNRSARRNKIPRMLNDTGQLALRNTAFSKNSGREFGIENRLPYASVQNFGGSGRGGTIQIGRRRMRTKGGRLVTVRAYSMRVKSGHRIPARRFFPRASDTFPIIRKIYADYIVTMGKRF